MSGSDAAVLIAANHNSLSSDDDVLSHSVLKLEFLRYYSRGGRSGREWVLASTHDRRYTPRLSTLQNTPTVTPALQSLPTDTPVVRPTDEIMDKVFSALGGDYVRIHVELDFR